jgi:hypothetical protein
MDFRLWQLMQDQTVKSNWVTAPTRLQLPKLTNYLTLNGPKKNPSVVINALMYFLKPSGNTLYTVTAT